MVIAQDIEQEIQLRMSKKRFIHTLAVKEKAIELCKIYGEDEDKAKIAALLHDVTKELKYDNQLQILRQYDIIFDKTVENSPQVLHAITGKIVAESDFGVTDEDILNSILYHTTARAGMTKLEQIIYVADAISADRDYKNVEKYRKVVLNDLQKTMFLILRDSLRFLLKEKILLHVDSINAYNQLLFDLEER